MGSRPWWKSLLHVGGTGVVEAGAWSLAKTIAAAVLGTSGVGTLVAAITLHWHAWALSLSAMAVMAALLFFWSRHINRLGAIAKAQTTPPTFGVSLTDPGGAMVFGQMRSEKLLGIATIHAVGIFFARRPDRWKCICVADFVGLVSGATASPWELVLTGKNGSPELAILKTDNPANGSGVTTYLGDAPIDAMEEAISATMGELTNTYPPPPETFCEVEIRLPTGQALAAHLSSRVRLTNELVAHGPGVSFIVRAQRDDQAPQ